MKTVTWLTVLAWVALLGVQVGLAKGREMERRDYLERVEIQAARLKLAVTEAAPLRGCCDEEDRR